MVSYFGDSNLHFYCLHFYFYFYFLLSCTLKSNPDFQARRSPWFGIIMQAMLFGTPTLWLKFSTYPQTALLFTSLDQGCIASFKYDYRRSMMSRLITLLHEWESVRSVGLKRGCNGLANGYPPNIRDAMQLVVESWATLPQETIVNCFSKSKVLPDTQHMILQQLSDKWNRVEHQEEGVVIAKSLAVDIVREQVFWEKTNGSPRM
eukprot:c35625_g1_i1.p1 GENE.c35625_g1_i1~~c35625_g1_i1.p1  ORF type:complete len:205 (+),score=9.80 c35625_g1_i1:111-725(+)